MSGRDELPSTVRRSPAHAQEIWVAAHDSAVEEYGEGERAHRTAFSALKHSFEKIGDHWEPKADRGPSDPRAAKGSADPRPDQPTAGGVDANATKAHLLDVARRLDIPRRTRMTKPELVSAIRRANDRQTRAARGR